jgi:2-methylcitrate dehydratase PrpD
MQSEKRAARAEESAAFVVNSPYENLSPANRDELKIRIVDALVCAFGAMQACGSFQLRFPILQSQEWLRAPLFVGPGKVLSIYGIPFRLE